jgi:hypothetical protein
VHACAEVEPSSTDILIWSDRQAEKAFARWLREKRREEMVKRRTEPTCDQLKEEQKVPALRRLRHGPRLRCARTVLWRQLLAQTKAVAMFCICR